MKPLRFRSDGSFRIAQFTDVHLSDFSDEDYQSLDLMDYIVQLDSPDLVVLSGDIIHTHRGVEPVPLCELLINRIEMWETPWAFVFGNHDAERVPYELIDELLKKTTTGYYESGPRDINGWGNYALPILRHDSDEVAAAVFSLDSGRDDDGPLSGWGYVHENQVDWFRNTATELLKEDVTGLMFIHNPVPEYDTLWDTGVCFGYKFEKVCFQGKDTGLFKAMKDVGISAMFCGHDHTNDYEGTWEGVDLCYGRGSGYGAYGKDGYQRGARIIELREGTRGYSGYIRLADGTVADRPIHEPEAAE